MINFIQLVHVQKQLLSLPPRFYCKRHLLIYVVCALLVSRLTFKHFDIMDFNQENGGKISPTFPFLSVFNLLFTREVIDISNFK